MHVKSQEFLAIVGENGVGKTTLMRLIFRICKQDAGTIKLYGKPIESYHKRELYHQIGLDLAEQLPATNLLPIQCGKN